jgi:phage shock protein PspC (stress-responsive transcriptional regulator)
MTTDPFRPQAGPPGGAGTPPQDPTGRAPSSKAPAVAFFNRIRSFGLVRPDEGRIAAGVCVGLARRLGVDPLLVRGIVVVLAVIGGFGLGLYGLAWLLLPHPDGRIHAEGALHGVITSGFVGSVVLVVLDLAHSGRDHWTWGGGPGLWLPGSLVPLAIIALVWWLVAARVRGSGPYRQAPVGTPYPPYGGVPGSGPGVPGGPASGSAGAGSASGGSAPEGTTSSPVPPYGTPPAPGQPYPGQPYPGEPYAGQPYAGQAYAGQAYPGQPPAGPAGSPAGTPSHPTVIHPPAATAYTQPRLDLHAPSHPLTLAVLGLALVGAAGVVLWDHLTDSLPAHAGLVAPAVSLGIVSLGVIVAGLLGRRSGGLAPIAVLLALVSIGGAVGHGVDSPVGSQLWRPESPAAAESGFTFGVGDATLDLTRPGLTAGRSSTDPVDIPVHLGMGRIRIVVPDGTAVQVDASVGAGTVIDDVNGNRTRSSGNDGGAGLKRVVHAHGDNPVIIVRTNVGLGSVEIEPQGQVVTP